MKIIGLTAHAKTGKDTLAGALTSRYSQMGFQRFAFADNLKKNLSTFIQRYFGYDVFNLTNEQKEIVRPLFIAFGCAKRKIDADYWVKQVDLQIEGAHLPIVITDFRFPSEAKYFAEKYGKDFHLFELKRDGVPTPPDEELVNQPLMKPYVEMTITMEDSPSHYLQKHYTAAGVIFNRVFA